MIDPRLKMISYRAWRRGFREADLILGPFADAWLGRLSDAQLDAFEHLLDQPDQDLYAWIIGQTPAPTAFQGEVLDLICDFRREDRGA
jgi:antitoxin CptB